MAAVDDVSSVLLLRALRSGAVDVDCSFVHLIDVCAAAPDELVSNLQPVPGTDLAEDGYNSVWYFYCPKRFKNAQGKPSGHRQRAIAGGETCWHSEAGPKPVKGLDGATHCNLSYGRKEGSSRSFNRMGWCMTEYDDKDGGGGDHVLCKVHRSSSSLAKGKSKSKTQSSSSGCKRKATDEHPQAPPMKMSLPASVDPMDHQVLPPLLIGQQMTMPDYESLFPAEEDQLQQNSMFPADEQQQMTVPDCESLFLPDDEQLQQGIFFPAEGQQLDQISMIPAEEQQLQQQNIFFPAEDKQQLEQDIFIPAEEQQLDQITMIPAEEQQLQQQNIFFPAEQQQQQLEQDIFFPVEEQQPLLDENTLFTMEELLRGLGMGYGEHGACSPNHEYTMDDLLNSSSGCCNTPKAMPPPDAVFFEGLAAF